MGICEGTALGCDLKGPDEFNVGDRKRPYRRKHNSRDLVAIVEEAGLPEGRINLSMYPRRWTLKIMSKNWNIHQVWRGDWPEAEKS